MFKKYIQVYLEKSSMMIKKYLAPNVDGQGVRPQTSSYINSRGQEACEFDKEKVDDELFPKDKKHKNHLCYCYEKKDY